MRGIPVKKRLLGISNWLRREFSSQAIILLYHRVVELPSDPLLLSVGPQHFAEHLEILRKYCCPISLKDLVKAKEKKSIPPKGVVITFDDGYADNLYEVKPLLERFGIPATAFIITGYAGGERFFWWDELERLFLQPGKLPPGLSLDLYSALGHGDLGADVNYSEEDFRQYRHWNLLDKADPTLRQRLYRAAYEILSSLAGKQQQELWDRLLLWAGLNSSGQSAHRPLSEEELLRLQEGGLIEVGAHTVTHPVLSRVSADLEREEIQKSKTFLEERLGHAVNSFAYPYGSKTDYTRQSVALVEEAGFHCACANFPEAVWPESSVFELPRLVVRDWDGEEFLKHLRLWLSL